MNRNSKKDIKEELKKRFAPRVNFNKYKIERFLLKYDNGYYKTINEKENFILTAVEEKALDIIQDETFDMAMQMGLIVHDYGYKWKGTNGELALFAELLSEKFLEKEG